MVDKLHDYQGFTGRVHTLRDMAREKLDTWKEEHPEGVKGIAMNVIKTDPHSRGPPKPVRSLDDYPHIYRRKTRMELIRVSAAVMGIEFSYAAETAFVSPALLKIGVTHQHMPLVWGLSPLIGFFLTPVLGSLSDGCRLIMGRRRPFILILALGIFIGLILVPNGKDIGHALGDYYPSEDLENYSDIYLARNLLESKNFSDRDENINFLESKNFSDFHEIKNYLESKNFSDCYLNFKESKNFGDIDKIKNSQELKNSDDIIGNNNLPESENIGNINDIKNSPKQKNLSEYDVMKKFLESKNFGDCHLNFLESSLGDLNATKNFLESYFSDCYLNFLQSKNSPIKDFLESKNFNNCYLNYLESKSLSEFYGNITSNETEANKNSNEPELSDSQYSHPWGVFFTILGTVLLDFDADSCQSPARAYLLDVTLPEDHAKGLSTFTIMAGLGGFFGYALGGTNWDATAFGAALGGHVRAVFTLITVLFFICVLYTVTSFKEIPLDLLTTEKEEHNLRLKKAIGDAETLKIAPDTEQSYGSVNKEPSLKNGQIKETAVTEENVIKANGSSPADNQLPNGPMEVHKLESQSHAHPKLKEYLLSIIFMPHSLRMLCLTNFFCWMAHVCYSLYFTDFVGEAVFNGDPKAPEQSEAHELYEEGIRFGCWGMAMYSLSCSCYSLIIESLIKRFKARNVYIGGLLVYSLGMLLLALTKNKIGVILFSWTAGVMYSTLFTMPYLLVAHYHANGVFGLTEDGEVKLETRLRGLGTDVAIVSSMVFLAQFILSICMGSIIEWTGTTTAVVSVASFLAFCGAVSATKVMYLDL